MKIITHCAQRGCVAEVELPDEAEFPSVCPVCNNPLIGPNSIVRVEVSHAKPDEVDEAGLPLLAMPVGEAIEVEPDTLGADFMPADNGVGSFPS